MKLGSTIGRLAAAAVLTLAAPAFASDWAPSGSLTLQIGFGAGGSTDTIGRVLGKTIEEQTGWNVVVENKAGGGGVAMFTGIANRPPRGDVIGMGVNMPILINLVRRGGELGFDLDSFEYLATVAFTPVAVVTAADAPFDDLEGMIEHAKASGPVPVAFDALPQKLAFDAVARETGAEFNMVSTKGGTEGLKLILGGQVMAAFGGGEHIQYLDSGDMKVVATTSAKRLSYAPDVKTFLESGVNVYADPYFYIATTAGTPPEAVEALAAAIDNAMQSEEFVEVVNNTVSYPPENLGPDGTKQMMVDGIENFKNLFAE